MLDDLEDPPKHLSLITLEIETLKKYRNLKAIN